MPSRRSLVGAFLALPFVLSLAGLAFAAPDHVARREASFVPADQDGRVSVVLRTDAKESVAQLVTELGGEVRWIFENLDAVSALVPRESLAALTADPRVNDLSRARLVRRAVVTPELPALRSAEGLARHRPLASDGTTVPIPGAENWSVRSVSVTEVLAPGRDSEPVSFLGYDWVTGAAQAWDATGGGEGALVAIIDTGVYPDHPLIEGSTIGGFNLVPPEEEEAIDLDGNGSGDGRSFDWDAVENNSHGTFVGGLIAGHAALELDADDPFAASVALNSPESIEINGDTATIFLMGAAPGASLYGVKVFPYDGGAAPDARVAEAIDRLVTMKRTGELDVDVINMSLSGPVLFDGWNPLDRMVDKATFFGITSVCAAANDGPALVSVGSPGSAYTSLTAGGAMDPIHTRVAVEVLFGAPPGAGEVFYPYDLKMADFASRGLTGDRRVKPDITATAMFLFSSNTIDVTGDGVADIPSFGFGSGTSFSTPTIAGCAALLHVFGDQLGAFGRAPFVANALKVGAIPIEGPFSQRDQGRGFVHVPAAMAAMANGPVWWPGRPDPSHPLQQQLNLAGGHASGSTPELGAAETFDFLVRIPDGVGELEVSFPDFTLGGVQNPFFGDAVQVFVHSAKRGGSGDYVFAGSLEGGDSFVWEFPEPGTARITVGGAPSNYSPVSASVDIQARPIAISPDWMFQGVLERDELVMHTIDVPAGLDALAVRLAWTHDWSRWPTYDLDLAIQTPSGALIPVASIDSPELAWLENPEAGTWTFAIRDFSTVLFREHYRLDVAALDVGPVREEAVLDLGRPRIAGISPNPVRSTAEVEFAIPARGPVKMHVYDVTGRHVRTLVDGPLEAGTHRVRWDGRTEVGGVSATGVYFLRLETENGTSSRKMVRLN